MENSMTWECPIDGEIFSDDDPRIIERDKKDTPFCPAHPGIKLIPAD